MQQSLYDSCFKMKQDLVESIRRNTVGQAVNGLLCLVIIYENIDMRSERLIRFRAMPLFWSCRGATRSA